MCVRGREGVGEGEGEREWERERERESNQKLYCLMASSRRSDLE
jgi:hypothetical protein